LNAASISSLPLALRRALLDTLSRPELEALHDDWHFWARPDQCPPAESAPGRPWTTWLMMGGRGAGKTRAGAEWIRGEIEARRAHRIALVGETLSDVRDVMIEGPSGLCALRWRGARPQFQASRRRVTFETGAQAYVFSAEDPDSLRGHQFDRAWSDELSKWAHGVDTWNNLQFGLRLGERPRQAATTTPAPVPLIRRLLDDETTTVTRASTFANRANLAPAFFEQIIARYEGTRLARQEIDGELITEVAGALWTAETIDAARLKSPPALKRIVVAVDPPASSGPNAAACGIIVAGCDAGGDAHVLADRTLHGCGPLAWARVVANTYAAYMADRVVVEVNQGGEMVGTLLHQVDRSIAVRAVHATRSKHVRAEPVAALYEQGSVHHVGTFRELEDQMCSFSAAREPSSESPDRVDALVWALTDLMLRDKDIIPRVRRI